jgi:hypothetical protein
MTAVFAEESSLSSERSWDLKAELLSICLNAGGAESALGPIKAVGALAEPGQTLHFFPQNFLVLSRVLINRGSRARLDPCPLSGALRTQAGHRLRSEKCQTATYEHLFDPLVGAGEHGRRNGEEAIAGVTDDGDTL